MRYFCCVLLLSLLVGTGAAQPNPVPYVNQPLVPSVVKPGSSGFVLTVNGAGFVPASVVEWNGSARATTFVSNTQLTAIIAAADVANASTASVRVMNPGAQTTSNAVFLPITQPLPLTAFANSDINVKQQPDSVAIGDLNNDGIPDLALCIDLSGTVDLYQGHSKGNFTLFGNYKIAGNSGGCVSVVMGDVNGDGNLDVIASNDASLVVLLGNGDGTIKAPKTNWIAGTLPGDVEIADLNGDGKLDLIAANFGSATISVLLGNGDGTFQKRQDYGSLPLAIATAVGDFNQDGILDIAASAEQAGAVIFLGNGDGTFQPGITYPAGENPGHLAVADLNGDGKLDLFVNDEGQGTAVLLGNGDGTFQSPLTFGGQPNLTAAVLGDLNGDGKLDAMLANHLFGGVQIFYGNGDGTFQTPFLVEKGFIGTTVAAADFNNDGLLDVVFAVDAHTPIMIQTTDAVNPGKLDFGSHKVGTSSQLSSTLLNFGHSDITIQNISVTGKNTSDFSVVNTCGAVLLAGQSCTLTVAFTPTTTGSRFAAVTVKDTAPGPPLLMTLFGQGS